MHVHTSFRTNKAKVEADEDSRDTLKFIKKPSHVASKARSILPIPLSHVRAIITYC